MKLQMLLTACLFTFGALLAQSAEISLSQPIATADNMLAPLTNPAALGVGNSYGLGWMHLNEDNDWKDHYWLYSNSEGLSYVYEKVSSRVNTHLLATGWELTGPYVIPNLYVGASYKWVNNKYKQGGVKSGLLYRPWDFSSLAATLDNPYHDSPVYNFGVGWRPLATLNLLKDYRLELTADETYAKTEGEYEFTKPILGINTEILDGIKLGGNYNLETESFGLTFSLCTPKLQTGSTYQNTDDLNRSLEHIFIPEKDFLSFMVGKNSQWLAPSVKNTVVTYKAPKYQIGPFKIYDKEQTGVEDLIKEIGQAGKDNTIRGLVFVNRNFSSSLALKQEIISAIREFKLTGKKVIFYYDNMSNGDYIFAASVADKIYLNPQGTVDLKGIAVNAPYLGDALKKIGIEVMNFRSHPYKTAGNMLSEANMTPEERIEYENLLGSLYTQMCQLIRDGRGNKLTKPVTEIIDEGPYYLAEDALQAGLVDELIYETQFEEDLKNEFQKNRIVGALPDYQTYAWSHPKKTRIAVVYAQGNIVMGEGVPGKIIAQETTAKIIRNVRKSSRYKGILLRIDSGGGSAQASDIIYKEIDLAKTENKKPVVVSMAGVAGSGGYYIACNSDYIYASPSTLTGSIGVIGLAFSAEDMFHKLYINWDTVKKGSHSDLGNLSRKWTEDEKAILQKLIASSYKDFVRKVAVGRNKVWAEIDSVAQGKVWTGEQALHLGLVDGLGGMKEAENKMKQLAKIKGDVELVDVSREASNKMISLSLSAMTNSYIKDSTPPIIRDYMDLYELWQSFESDKVLFLSDLDLSQVANF
jgi:protease IV